MAAGKEQAKQERRAVRRRLEREAARRPPGRNARLLSLGAGAILAVVVAAVVVAVNRPGGAAPSVTSGDPVLGKADAPVTIVEYGDFKCPVCTAFSIETEPRLRREFVDTGRVRLVWRDFTVIDAESEPAAEAARCAGGQGRFWAYHDALYHYTYSHFYAKGSSAEGVRADTGHYDQLARQAGVTDIAAFDRCLAGGTYRALVARDRNSGLSAGVNGTPTFFVNGQRVVGGQPYDVFRRLIEAQLH